MVYLSTIKFCEEVFISKIEKNKFPEITSQKINTLIQGNNISGENIGNTGVFQNNTIENVNISLESSGEIATKESTQLSKNIEVNKNQALIQANFFLPDNLPNGYVKRPDALNSLLEALVNHHNDMVGVVGATALHGLGGLGKTVLARAICEELEILNNFPDGILWATVGQDSDPVVNQREWINTL
ncbi:MAG: NB-ARC domain-containing protein, partial [Trichodesmium sp. St19_bin1]|nr:NB-ARC domain-containing protein [Trichodesmium sp. St19_bin1]